MEKAPDNEIKVIAIKLPSDLQERILTFPFLHAISEYYPKAALHFITPKHQVEVLKSYCLSRPITIYTMKMR